MVSHTGNHIHVYLCRLSYTYNALHFTGSDIAKLKVFGTGKPMRQFIFSHDLARLIIWVLLNYDEVEPIISSVSEEEEISIGQAAQFVANAFSDKVKVVLEYDETWSDGQFKKTASNYKLRKYLPDFKFTSIDEGIKQTAEWFTQNYALARK